MEAIVWQPTAMEAIAFAIKEKLDDHWWPDCPWAMCQAHSDEHHAFIRIVRGTAVCRAEIAVYSIDRIPERYFGPGMLDVKVLAYTTGEDLGEGDDNWVVRAIPFPDPMDVPAQPIAGLSSLSKVVKNVQFGGWLPLYFQESEGGEFQWLGEVSSMADVAFGYLPTTRRDRSDIPDRMLVGRTRVGGHKAVVLVDHGEGPSGE